MRILLMDVANGKKEFHDDAVHDITDLGKHYKIVDYR